MAVACATLYLSSTPVPNGKTRSGSDRGGFSHGDLALLLHGVVLDLVEAEERFTPEREDSAGQPAIEDEGPVEPDGEELLDTGVGEVDAVPPLIHRHLHHLRHRGGDQQEERPGKTLPGPVHRGYARAAVQVGPDRQ